MRLTKRTNFVRLICSLLAVTLSLGSVASASMMGMIPIQESEQVVLKQGLDDSHNIHLQLSPSDISHERMMKSSDHAGSHGITCEILCSVPASLLPHSGNIPSAFRLTYLWSIPELPEYLFNFAALIYKPPRA